MHLLHDAKLGELSGVPAPADVDVLHARGGRPVLGPPEELLDGLLLPSRDELDASVVTVLDPPPDAEPARLALRGRAEIPLEPAPE